MSEASRKAEFESLVRDHQVALFRYLRYLGADEGLATEMVQETFLAVWRKPFEVRGPGETRAYLRTVARNHFLMAVRRRRVRPAFADLDEADRAYRPRSGDDAESYLEALRVCLGELTDRAREALGMVYRDGRSREEVGEALGLAVEGVKTLLRRARETLRDCVSKKVGA